MASIQPHHEYLHDSNDLVTSNEEIRSGFLSIALEKNRRSTPYVAQARALKAAAARAANCDDLLKMPELRLPILTAAGMSDKALGNISSADTDYAVKEFASKYLQPAGAGFVDELVYRFLLIRGDTLGGVMRNIAGAIAKRKLARSIMAALSIQKIPYLCLSSTNGKWTSIKGDDTDIEISTKGISWSRDEKYRTLLFDIGVPIVEKNIDICLFDCPHTHVKAAIKKPEHYIALGELKGGIDPAGADEHWKTTGTALKSIRDPFATHHLSPYILFIGAAIAKKMAAEMWVDLESGVLSNAANLTKDDQMAAICRWLINLDPPVETKVETAVTDMPSHKTTVKEGSSEYFTQPSLGLQ